MIVDTISPERLMQLVDAISVAFPEEIPATYYVKRVPAVNGQRAILPKGILYDKYTSCTKLLREAGIRSGRRAFLDDCSDLEGKNFFYNCIVEF